MGYKKSAHARSTSSIMTVCSRLSLCSCVGLLLIAAPVTAQSRGNGFADNFSAYPAAWSSSGNISVAADRSIFVSAPQSVRLSGYIGWEALIHRPLNAMAPFKVEAFVYLTAPASNFFRGRTLSALPDWHGAYRYLLWFDKDGVIRGADSLALGSYTHNRWYKVAIAHERVDPSTVRVSYWIDDVPAGVRIITTGSDVAVTYLTLESGDGTVRFDDVSVAHARVGSRLLSFDIGSNADFGLFAASVLCRGDLRAWI